MFLISSSGRAYQRFIGGNHQKAILLALLILICALATFYSHFIVHREVAFSHLFYIPVVLAGLWWGRRGAWVAVLLGVLLLASHYLSGLNTPPWEDLLRSLMILAVGLTVGILREYSLRAEEALREETNYLESLINYANAPIIVWNPGFKITRFNHAFERLTGHNADEVVGQTLDILFPENSREDSMNLIRQAQAGERWEIVEIPILHVDGSVRTVLWNSAGIYAADGTTITATIAQGQDITKRKQAEAALREKTDYLESLINYANAPIIVWDPKFRITRFNHAFERLTGRSADEVVGQTLDLLFPENSREDSMSLIRQALAGERWEVVEIPILHVDGSVRTVLWNSAGIYTGDGKTVTATIAQGQDITERKKLEKEVLEISDREQRRIGQDLHDELGQKLTGIAFLSKALAQQLVGISVTGTTDAIMITDLANEAIDSTRRLAGELYPVELEKSNLESALKRLTENVEDIHGITGIFGSNISVPLDERRVAIHLYRIAQEAVNNALKHAKATRIVVNLNVSEDSTRLTIWDDGIGLAKDFESRAGVGRYNMRYRANMIGAALRIQPGENGGTEVICSKKKGIT